MFNHEIMFRLNCETKETEIQKKMLRKELNMGIGEEKEQIKILDRYMESPKNQSTK